MAANTGVLPMENKKMNMVVSGFYLARAVAPPGRNWYGKIRQAKKPERDDIDDLRKHDDSLSLCYRCFSDF